MNDMLSHQDVLRLLKDPSPSSRAAVAEKVGNQFAVPALSHTERQIATDIIRRLAKDVAVKVRTALVESLKTNPDVPKDVALALARDVEEVSLPFIELSEVLGDADLIEIIRSGSPEKQSAVARRPNVSSPVADVLVDEGCEQAVADLMANATAQVSDTAMNRALDRFPESTLVHAPMVARSRLPVTVAERLVALVSEQLHERLIGRHELPLDVAADLIMQSRERATYSLVGGAGEEELQRLVAQLKSSGRLTPSLVLRALCMGDMPFFEMALGQLAGVPVPNARLLIHDAGKLGLKSLFERAGLPPRIYPAIRVAVDVAQETDFDGGERDLERRRRRMLERILTQFEEMGGDDLDYLMNKLSDLTLAA